MTKSKIMRKLITTVCTALMLLLSVGAIAEELVLDSAYFMTWNSNGSSWGIDSKEYYTYTEGLSSTLKTVNDDNMTIVAYDSVGHMTEITTMEWDDSVWVYTEKMIYTYKDENVVEEIKQTFDSIWINVEKRIKDYDTYDNLTSWYDVVWSIENESWTPEEGEEKTTKTFDANGQEIGKHEQTYIAGNWVDSKIYTYTLNNEGLVTEVQAKELDGDKWVNASANAIYKYDERGNIITEIWNLAASDSVIGDYSEKYRKWDYVYNDKDQVVQETQYRNTTSTGEYKTYYQYTYEYDSVGNMTLRVKDRYNSDYTGFAPYRKYISNYDEYGNEVYNLELRANTDKDGYYNYRLYTKVFNEEGIATLDRRDDFEDGEWEVKREYDYTINDSTGWVTEIQARDWADSLWVNTLSNAIYMYDSVGNITTEIWNKTTDTSALGQYDQLYFKWERSYDEAGNLLVEERLRGNSTNDGYNIDRKYTFQYDSLDNEVYELQERENNGAYYSYNEYIRSYDKNSNLLEQVWNNKTSDKTALKTYRKYTYEYNDAGQETLFLYQKANTEDSLTYDNYKRELTSYSAEGYLTSLREEAWETDAWVLDQETIYEISVDDNGLITKSIEIETEDDIAFDTLEMKENFYTDLLLDSSYYSEYDAGKWIISAKEYYTYQDSILVSKIVDELDERITYTYDEDGNVLCEMTEELIDSEWVKIEKRIREFDANGETTMYTDKVWDETYLWTIEAGAVMHEYEFDANGIKIDEKQSVWDAGYSKINKEIVADFSEENVDDIFVSNILFTITEDDENYENYKKEVYYYSTPKAAALEDVTSSAFARLYPNPSATLVHLPEGDYSFSIYASNGALVMKGQRAQHNTISVANMAKGIYIVKYQSEESTTTERLIVK